MLGHIPAELNDLQLRFEVPLEAAEQDLALPRLHAVYRRWYGTYVVVHREVHELLVDEVHIPECLDVVVHEGFGVVAVQPTLPVVGSALVEAQVDGVVVVLVDVLELDAVPQEVGEVVLCLLIVGCPESFVILGMPELRLRETLCFLPLRIVMSREELDLVVAPRHLDDRRNKFGEEARHMHQRGPKMVYEVHDQSLDVTPIRVLVGHQHDGAVAETLQVLILAILLQAHDLDDVGDLLVVDDLRRGGITYVEELTPQWEHAIVVASYDVDCCHHKGFGTVSLGQD